MICRADGHAITRVPAILAVPTTRSSKAQPESALRTTRDSIVRLLSFAAAAGFAAGTPSARSAPTIPDPCKLITPAELEQIAGPLKGAPKPGDIASGDVSCEYKPAKGAAWISVRLHDGELGYWSKRNGGTAPVALPEFGKDAFANPDFEGSTDLYAKKGSLILRVSLPKGPQALDTAKAIARKALTRL
jgi:hypothetical protein